MYDLQQRRHEIVTEKQFHRMHVQEMFKTFENTKI